jgi:rhomboid protease GluP
MDSIQTNETETFAAYVARTLIAHNGFEAFAVPEATAIADHCDIVLTRSDGMEFEIVAIVDGEINPERFFDLDAETLRQIGKDCLKYSGSVHRAKLPVKISVFEIGPSFDNQDRRNRLRRYTSSFFAKVRPSAWILDTEKKTVWSNNAFGGRLAGRGRYERLLREPRVELAELQPPVPIVEAPESFPFVTYGLLAILVAAFACELAFGLDKITGILEPSIATLEAMGGLTRGTVVNNGEWFRLITAAFLHADLMHIALNGIVLFFAGRALEKIVGHAWFTAIYAISAVCGGLMSLLLLAPNIVSVGASGAIMGILGAMLAISFRFPKGVARTQLQMLSFQVLIPSLLPLAPAASGNQVDFGAHLGGALGGLLTGIAMAMIWPRQSPLPRLRWAATTVAAVWIAAAMLSAVPAVETHAKARELRSLQAMLMPNNKIPADHAATLANAETLLGEYPRDPRAHLYTAQVHIDKNDLAKAEEELRLALGERTILASFFNPAFERALRATLAAVLLDAGKAEEAKAEAKPACGDYAADTDNVREIFDRLCKETEIESQPGAQPPPG